MKIIGIKENKGVYEDRPYTNYSVYLQTDNNVNDCGICVYTIKIKEYFLNVILKNRGFTDKSELIGLDVNNIYYDSFRNVVDLVG